MTVTHCQHRQAGCGACCGIYNLDLTPNDREALLASRTGKFEENYRNAGRQAHLEFRHHQERLEEELPRHRADIYVCPLLGYVAPGRVGCLVHPVRTGDPRSQDVSFYGSSICQTYDCPAREADPGLHYADLVAELVGPADYGRLMADYAFYRFLKAVPAFRPLVSGQAKRIRTRRVLGLLLEARLQESASRSITSFELPENLRDAGQLFLTLFQESLERNDHRAGRLKRLGRALALPNSYDLAHTSADAGEAPCNADSR
ncbi:MAG: hypothetical protein H7A21_04280 [Spirochaetales bacterium]|nr:hypothetical protein [Leptospiraceae bacterium]MCP5480631.1 hypothetical protein [Spirochaetales bacterium]MCP5483983.1 hypothetical protein [Spirochaetales bacterium]